MSIPSVRFLNLLVFTAGLVTLGVELAGSRLLDPWFGNSLIVWANLIGLILLYLAAGAWLGGRVADRSPHAETLFRLTAWGAGAVGLIPVLSRPLLALAADAFDAYNAALLIGSFLAVLALFAIPVILLGSATPFALRLVLTDVQHSGQTAGRLSALATLGSISGTFGTVLLLIPNVGTRRTFFLLSLLLLGLALGGLWHARRRPPWSYIILWLLILTLALQNPGAVKSQTDLGGGGRVEFETESAYNYIQVLQQQGEVLLKLNEGQGIHSVYRPNGGLADGIWDYFLLAPSFSPTPHDPADVQRMALIGLAGGTISSLYSQVYGPLPIDGVELDPAVIAVGRRWFGMNQPNLNAVAQDGRYFLAHTTARYDVIAVDAYRPPYIPFHLTTVEFFSSVREHLTPNGVVAINAARTADDYRLVDALTATLQVLFPSVLIIEEPTNGATLGNSLVIASQQPVTLADWETNTARLTHPLLVTVAQRARGHARLAPVTAAGKPWRDDLAPVEQTMHGLILRFLLAE